MPASQGHDDTERLLECGLERCVSNIPAFKEALKDPRPGMRIAGVRALGWLRLPELGPILAPFLSDESDEVRRWAAASIALTRDTGSVESILIALRTERHGNIRAALIRALGWIGCQRAQPQLEIAASQDHAAVVRASAFQALGRLGVVLDGQLLRQGIRDDAPSVRMQALRLLGDIEWSELRALLSDAWRDPDPEVRLTAVRVAVAHGTHRARDMCLEALIDMNPAVRIAGLVGIEQALYAVERSRVQMMVKDPHGEVGWHARRLLTKHQHWLPCD
ncbi:MAG: HEAT repeat domain-containing protein [Bradymonadia bacterium]